MIASIFSPRRYLHCNHIWSKNYNNYIFVSVNYLNKCLCNIIIKNRCSMPKGYTDEKYRCNSSYHVRCTSCTCFFHYYITPYKLFLSKIARTSGSDFPYISFCHFVKVSQLKLISIMFKWNKWSLSSSVLDLTSSVSGLVRYPYGFL